MTNLLSAPAIFFWGIGTSEIGTNSLGWSESTSAAALAVATIVIPGLDAFFANQNVEQWLDKVRNSVCLVRHMHLFMLSAWVCLYNFKTFQPLVSRS